MKKGEKQNNNPNHCDNLVHLPKFKSQDIVDEIEQLGITKIDKESVQKAMDYILLCSYSKCKYILDNCKRCNSLVTMLAAGVVSDVQTRKTGNLQMMLNRLLGKEVAEQNINIQDNNQPLLIEFANEEDKAEIKKLIG